jgi:hypothetical protein
MEHKAKKDNLFLFWEASEDPQLGQRQMALCSVNAERAASAPES